MCISCVLDYYESKPLPEHKRRSRIIAVYHEGFTSREVAMITKIPLIIVDSVIEHFA